MSAMWGERLAGAVTEREGLETFIDRALWRSGRVVRGDLSLDDDNLGVAARHGEYRKRVARRKPPLHVLVISEISPIVRR